jgi:hypothetical protein
VDKDRERGYLCRLSTLSCHLVRGPGQATDDHGTLSTLERDVTRV